MADGDLFLVSATGDTINLNALSTANNGVQVTAGLTGFGLPSVEVMYQVGAGDGAKYRGQRALPRDIDLPLHILGTTRAELRSHVNRLAKALAGECRLQWDDGSRLWETRVRRVGGGEYVYGADTEGLELNLTITLRAEDPMWTAVSAAPTATFTPGNVADVRTQVTVATSQFGTSPSKPVIKVLGPTMGFTVEDSTGTKLVKYGAFIPQNSTITVDMGTGRVTNQDGLNMYGGLSETPRFFTMTDTTNSIFVTLDRSSAAYQTASTTPVAKNYNVNPTFHNDASNWTLAQTAGWSNTLAAYDAAGKKIKFNSGTNASTSPTAVQTSMKYVISTGWLTPGQRYQVNAYVDYYEPWNFGGNYGHAAYIELKQNTTHSAGITYAGTWWGFDFVADGATKTLEIVPHKHFASTTGLQSVRSYGMSVTEVYITEYGHGYFDGDTTDTATILYQWSGTAHQSFSEKRPVTASKTATSVQLDLKARNWLVV